MLWVIAVELAVVIFLLWMLIADLTQLRRGLHRAGRSKEETE